MKNIVSAMILTLRNNKLQSSETTAPEIISAHAVIFLCLFLLKEIYFNPNNKYKTLKEIYKEFDYLVNHYRNNNKISVQIDINPLRTARAKHPRTKMIIKGITEEVIIYIICS